MPTGISVDSVSSDSLISIAGTSTGIAGSFNFTLQVTDTFGCVTAASYTIAVDTFRIIADSVITSGDSALLYISCKNNPDATTQIFGAYDVDSTLSFTTSSVIIPIGDTQVVVVMYNLQPSTAYLCQGRAWNAGMGANFLKSNILSFTTGIMSPIITDSTVINVDKTSATVVVSCNAGGGNPTTLKVDFGPTQSLGLSQTKAVYGETVTEFFNLTGLAIGDTVFYRITATNIAGSDATSILSVVTLNYELSVVTISANCSAGTMRVYYAYITEDSLATAWLEYNMGLTIGSFPQSTAPIDLSLGTSTNEYIEVTGLSGGIYTARVVYRGSDLVKQYTSEVSCETPTGMNEVEIVNAVRIFPNPASSELKILSSIKGTLVLYDVLGKQACRFEVVPGLNTLKIANLPRGLYLCSFLGKDQTVVGHRRIIIQ